MKWHKQVCFKLALKGFLPVDKYIKLKKILVKGDKFTPESDIGNKAVILEQCDTIDVESNTVLFQLDAMGCDSMTMDILRPNRTIGHEGFVMCDKVKI